MSSIIRPTPGQRTRRLVVLAAAVFAVVVPVVMAVVLVMIVVMAVLMALGGLADGKRRTAASTAGGISGCCY